MNLRAGAKVLLVLGALGLIGCGDKGLYKVSGTVSFKGQPLDYGEIQFQPTEPGGIQQGATIRDGAYEIPASKGLPPGKYRVLILALDGPPTSTTISPPSDPPGSDRPVSSTKQRLPEKYNTKTTLERTVEKGGKNVFDFVLD
jgi:hypothetical protein